MNEPGVAAGAPTAGASRHSIRRLLARAEFDAVMDSGRVVASTPHFALHRASFESPRVAAVLSAGPPCIGVLLPKRHAKRAVTRNTMRRQIYAVGQDSALRPAAHVVRLRTPFDRRQFVSATSDVLRHAVRAELRALFAKAGTA